MIKAVFIDFDETAYSHKYKKIPESTIKAIKMLNDKGIKSFLCSGRSPSEMSWFNTEGFDVSGSVLANGQVGIDNNGKILFSHPIEGKLLDALLNIFNKKKISMYFASHYDVYTNFINDAITQTQKAVSSPVPHVGQYTGEDIYMSSCFFSNDEEKKEICNLLANDASITTWHCGAIDIVPLGISKANGIHEMIEKYGIDISETMGIGDGENDIEMLKTCAIGVAMGNASSEVKNIADYITDDIDEDGLFNCLKHYNLI